MGAAPGAGAGACRHSRRPAMGNCSRAHSLSFPGCLCKSALLSASAAAAAPPPPPPPPTHRDRSYAHPCTSLPIFSTSRPPNPHRRPKDLASCLLASWTWAVDPTHEKSLSGISPCTIEGRGQEGSLAQDNLREPSHTLYPSDTPPRHALTRVRVAAPLPTTTRDI
jgi:hypothetical protein